MEKNKPHFPLTQVKACLKAGNVRITKVAYAGTAELGLKRQEMLSVVNGLSLGDFYKSMTAYNDHTQWQDVYRPDVDTGSIYLKLTIEGGLLIISFKEA